MAYSYNEVTATGSPQLITAPPYIDQSHIKVSINSADTTSFSWANANTVSVTATAGAKVRVRRETSPGARVVDYMDGMSLTEVVLDNDSKQAFYLAQEQLDATADASGAIGGLPAILNTINAAAGVAATHATNAANSATDAANSAVQATTNATNAANAVLAGKAQSGANTDITSLGAVTGVTAGAGDNSTKLATTAFVMGNSSPVGSIALFPFVTAPTGHLKCNGGTIGSSTSGATLRANADTLALFTVLWNNVPNTALAIQDSSGTASTRGASAAADFAANKRLPVPDLRGEFVRGFDDGRGVDAGRGIGSYQSDAMQGHVHFTNSYTHTNQYTGNGGGTGLNGGAINTGGPISDGTNGTPRTAAETRPRNIALLYCIKY